MYEPESKPLRVGFYLNSFPVTSETFILRQIASLIELGHDVFIIAEKQSASAQQHLTLSKYEMMDRVNYLAERKPNSGTSRFRTLAKLIALATTKPNVVLGGKSSIKRELLAQAQSGKHYRFDALVAHFGPNALSALHLVKRGIIDAPLIPVFHGYDVTRTIKQYGPDVYKELFQRSHLCLAISERWRTRLVELGCSQERAVVHRVGLDIDRYDFVVQKRRKGPFKALSVARLVEKKGIEYAIRAVANLRSAMEIQYFVVGEGPLASDLISLANSLGVRDIVHFVGAKSEQEVQRYMKSSDALIVPSVVASDGDEEGIPVVLMEAMASGLPVIATRHSGIPELVEDGISGYLVDEKDVLGISDRIFQIQMEGPGGVCDNARSKVAKLHNGAALALELEGFVRSARKEK